MLSREQLGDIINCSSIKCKNCSFNDMCNANKFELAAQTALELMDQVEAQQKEIERINIFTGKTEPTEDVISFLQNNREELIKWVERVGWHCKKVDEQYKEIEQLEKVIKSKSHIIQRYDELVKKLTEAKTIQNDEMQILKNAISLSKREIEQLEAQNGGLLEDITHLHTIVIPEYIGTLKKAKEALEMSWDETINWVEAQEKAMQTLEAIDKAIGGGE